MLLTLLPLGLRASLVVMISIPLSLAIGLSALYFTGFSLNQLSIAGFVLALGLLVDDSIVVVENIARHLRAGYSRIEAAIAATDQIALAVLGCTVTLLFAFLPLLFLPEGAGIFIRSLPAAVLYTVLASLFVAFTVIPFLASRVLKAGGEHGEGGRALQALTGAIRRWYVPTLQRALARRSARWSRRRRSSRGSLALVPLIGFSLFPSADIPQFRITIETPDGASLADTDRALRFVEDELAAPTRGEALVREPRPRQPARLLQHPARRRPTPTSRRCSPSCTTSTRGAARSCYERAAREVRRRTRARASSSSRTRTARRSTRRSRWRSRDPTSTQLRELAARAEQIIAATPGTRDVDNPVRRLRTDLDLRIDPQKAALLGVAPVEIDRTVRAAVAGLSAGKFREADGDEYDITLRLPMQGRPTLDVLDRIEVASATGRPVPLRQVASPEFCGGHEPDPPPRPRARGADHRAIPQTGYNTGKVTARGVRAPRAARAAGRATRCARAARSRRARRASAASAPRCWSRCSASSPCWCSSSAASARC